MFLTITLSTVQFLSDTKLSVSISLTRAPPQSNWSIPYLDGDRQPPLYDKGHHNGPEGRTQDYGYVTKEPWYSGASYSLPITMRA